MTASAAALAVSMRGIEKRFGAVAALRGIDLEVAGGQALAILGPNGAGKSTLLRILAGLARPTAGHCEIRLGDAALRPGRAAARARIGFAGHATLLYPELSARENLMFHGRLQGVRDPGSRADELLREEGLEDFADRRAGTFSRGMAQRLSIARARVQRPPLLLLDEPFTGLDRRSGDRLAGRLRQLRDDGTTIVLVTHDLSRASEIADTAAVLFAGLVAHRASGEGIARERLEAAYHHALDGPEPARLSPPESPPDSAP